MSHTALGDSARSCEVSIFAVHVVCATARTVAQPDAKVLDHQRLLLEYLQQYSSGNLTCGM